MLSSKTLRLFKLYSNFEVHSGCLNSYLKRAFLIRELFGLNAVWLLGYFQISKSDKTLKFGQRARYVCIKK